MMRRLSKEVAVAVSVVLLGAPGLPRAYGAASSGQSMFTDASNAVEPKARQNLLPGAASARFFAKDYGACTWDAAHDVIPCVQAAVNAAGAAGGGRVVVPVGVWGAATELDIGDGTATALSTVNAITLWSEGQPFLRLGQDSTLGTVGAQLKWIGAAGATMLKVLGPIAGVSVRGLSFDANNLAATCIRILSQDGGVYDHVNCANYTGRGWDIGTQAAATGFGDPSELSTKDLEIRYPGLWSNNPGAIGMSLDGYPGDGTNIGFDTTRIKIVMPIVGMTGTGGSVGIRLAFTDFVEIEQAEFFQFSGTDGTACPLSLIGTATSPNPGGGHLYPQTVHFSGNLDLGVGYAPCVSGTIGNGNDLGAYDTLGGAAVPRDPVTENLRGRVLGTDGSWSEMGQNVNETSLRNRFVNPGFRRASRGTSFVNPAVNAYTLDQWRAIYNGTQNQTITRQNFALGQTSVPGNPKYYLEWTYTANVSGTFDDLQQPVENVGTFAGKSATISAWMKASGCSGTAAVSAVLTQIFGSGGSPSGPAVAGSTAQTLVDGADWKRLAFTIAVPSISGKTLGSNGDDNVRVGWSIPPTTIAAGCVIDIAQPQVEAGSVDTAYEQRPAAVDEAMAARYLRTVGAGLAAAATSATAAEAYVPLTQPMRAAPSVVALAPGVTTVTLTRPGTGDATTTAAATLGVTAASPDGATITVSTFSGLTAGALYRGKADFALLSAEY